nr:40S ribosomal protein S29 [Ipomoea batatas]GMD84267.1 40S ribosomal protein S29 [Ipomoea batatas]
MGHSNIWNAHPKTYGPGSRACFMGHKFLNPCVWEFSWNYQKVRPYVLQTVLPQQRQRNRVHKGHKNCGCSDAQRLGGITMGPHPNTINQLILNSTSTPSSIL